jgi:hypothetical protein
MPGRASIDRDAFAAMHHYTSAEHRLLDDANRFMHAKAKLVEPKTAASLEIHPAYLHIHSEWAGS